ncbi:MAG: hypothetical protein KF773_43085 [Deltaproteobacteria bacterium]|nr:hypothetical protein [Deltaproteobacteria bacterium]MCW5802336.1 hypothetical protein [Deltaproteobacteria bacterium]
MSKLLLVVIALAGTVGSAHAGDSTWLVCKGIAERGKKGDVTKSHIVASLHEHRGADRSSRDLNVTLIYGVHVSRGDILGSTVDKKTGDVLGKAVPVKLSATPAGGKPVEVFAGTADVAKDLKTFTLKGDIDFAFGLDPKPVRVPFAAKMTCELLDDLAIKK